VRQVVFRIVLGGLALPAAYAAPWSFDAALAVTDPPPRATVFHHLDSSGRRSIAAAGQGAAVAWEDDRDGTPRVYLAYKGYADHRFTTELKVSGDAEAYAPSIVALGRTRFGVAWEEAGQVWLRLVEIGAEPVRGPAQKLSLRQGAQASLARDGDKLAVIWSEREDRYGRIRAQRLRPDGRRLIPEAGCAVDGVPPSDEQLYPSAAVLRGRLVVAWEDRRPKHTIIMAAVEQRPGACRFSQAARISENAPGRTLPYGAGHGVSRVALDRVGSARVFAAWADKRSFRNGYDIWGAFFDDGSARFGDNERVQDDFGGLSKQRHASVAGHPNGTLVVAWDDEREGNTDLMLSWRIGDGWSDDWPLPIASGAGWQGSPSIALDADGNLHAAWVERDEPGGATRLKYAFGRLSPEPAAE
jgi:hypothetical protein